MTSSIELQKKWRRVYELVYQEKSGWVIQPTFARSAELALLDKMGFEQCITLIHRGYIAGTGWHRRNLSPWTMTEPIVINGLADALEAISFIRNPERYVPSVDAAGRLHDRKELSAGALGVAELFCMHSGDCVDFLPEARRGLERWRRLMREKRDEAETVRETRLAAEITANPQDPRWVDDPLPTFYVMDRLPEEVRNVILAGFVRRRDGNAASP